MKKTDKIRKAFEKSSIEESPFMVFRIPGRDIELANLESETEFLIKPWQGQGISLASAGDKDFPDLPAETSKADYEKAFEKYILAFRHKGLKKAILSCVIREERSSDFDPISFFFRLCELYPTTFAYLLFHPKVGMWCGATPEVLLEGNKETFNTVALAGTQSAKPSQKYEWGEKEIEEQELVSHHIRNILENSGVKNLEESHPYTIRAAEVVHLKTDFRFKYSGGIRSLLDRLHPTPAIAGLPTAESIELIKAAENHNRSLYTGYIGMLNEKETRIYVNLRCMQIGDNELAIYTGGGITAKSDMEAEWEETRLKAKTLLNLLKITT